MYGMFVYNNKDFKNICNIVEFGGGVFFDIGCYVVLFVWFFMRVEFERVVCLVEKDGQFGIDILVLGILDFGGGRRSAFMVGI